MSTIKIDPNKARKSTATMTRTITMEYQNEAEITLFDDATVQVDWFARHADGTRTYEDTTKRDLFSKVIKQVPLLKNTIDDMVRSMGDKLV